MNALASLLKTTGLEKAVTDIGPVTKPTPPEVSMMKIYRDLLG